MKLLSTYVPLLKITSTYYIRPAILLVSRTYHSADYSGGGLMGRDSFTNPISTPPSKGPEDPFAHLDLAQLTDPRSVRVVNTLHIKHTNKLPYKIVQHLNEYVIGQERAKKVLAVAIFNHYNRVRANMKRQQLKLQKQQQQQQQQFILQQQQQQQQQKQQQQQQSNNTVNEAGVVIPSEERLHTEHHHPTLPQDYYSSQLPLQSHPHAEFPPTERSMSYGTIVAVLCHWL
jgi:hypothetical protein